MNEEPGDVIVESASAPFRPPAPRITQEITPAKRGAWAALSDLARRRRSQLAAVFALLIALAVALAFAYRPDPRSGADVESSAADGFAVSMPPVPDGGGGGEVDEGVVLADGPSAAPTDDSVDSSADDGTTTSSATATTAPSPSFVAETETSTKGSSTTGTSSAPTTPSAGEEQAATTSAPTTTTVEAPTTTFESVNLLQLSGFESPRLDEGVAYATDTPWEATGPVELWVDGNRGVPAYAGRQFAELNALSAITISQEVVVVPGAIYTWTFAHRARNDTDTVELMIDGEVIGRYSAQVDGWTVRSGEVAIPAGRTTSVVALRAVDAGSQGNFVDAFRFTRTG